MLQQLLQASEGDRLHTCRRLTEVEGEARNLAIRTSDLQMEVSERVCSPIHLFDTPRLFSVLIRTTSTCERMDGVQIVSETGFVWYRHLLLYIMQIETLSKYFSTMVAILKVITLDVQKKVEKQEFDTCYPLQV